MENLINFLENNLTIAYLAPIFTAIVIGVGSFIMKIIEKKVGLPQKIYNNKSVNVFNKYCEKNRIKPIVSYGDSHALKIISEMDKGNIKVRADVDLKSLPKNNDSRYFVMILLKFIPKSNLSSYYKKGYSIVFDIKSQDIDGVQLEIKDIHGAKVIDEYVKVTKNDTRNSFRLNDYCEASAWKEISEICFTIFTEEDYIKTKKGTLEISNCMLKIE